MRYQFTKKCSKKATSNVMKKINNEKCKMHMPFYYELTNKPRMLNSLVTKV